MASAQNSTYNQYSNNAAPSDLPPAYDVCSNYYFSFILQIVNIFHLIFLLFLRLYHLTITAPIRRISNCYNNSSNIKNMFVHNFLLNVLSVERLHKLRHN